MKIIQIIPMPNNCTYQGVIFGLGDDGNVYSWKNVDDRFGWVLEMPCVMFPS